ncbi:MAG TPA: hypothetical protein V6D14_35535 [Coleofasciculaceae cyanobacterium]
MGEAKLKQGRRYLQQFFTSFTNRNGTLYEDHCFTEADLAVGWEFNSNQRRVALLHSLFLWELTSLSPQKTSD